MQPQKSNPRCPTAQSNQPTHPTSQTHRMHQKVTKIPNLVAKQNQTSNKVTSIFDFWKKKGQVPVRGENVIAVAENRTEDDLNGGNTVRKIVEKLEEKEKVKEKRKPAEKIAKRKGKLTQTPCKILKMRNCETPIPPRLKQGGEHQESEN